MGFKALRCLKCALLAISCCILLTIYLIQMAEIGENSSNRWKGTVESKKDNESGEKHESKIDWVDYKYVEEEAKRTGPGEGGKAVICLSQVQQILAQASIQEYSYNGPASDLVSLDRSVPDTRHEQCKGKRYRKDLPAVSVVIVFYNEYLSFLLRTVHSIVNRTPAVLLKEIILVDDCSSKTYLHQELDDAVAKYRPDLVRVVRLKERSGLMRARMAGIRNATAEIVVVMDAHIEVNTNWLPPLIEPIAENPRVVTEPMVSPIHWNTLEYDPFVNLGVMGAFDWELNYEAFDRTYGDKPHHNYQNPVILGAIMAINRNYFWELEGYDDQLQVWGGEQFEISFKVWMCGGQLLRIPCSQVGHNFKEGGFHPYFRSKKPFLSHNLGRIAAVWLQEYKEKYYKLTHTESLYVGDISRQLAFRNKCKSFKWYLENVLPTLKKDFPIDNAIKRAVLLAGSILFALSVLISYLIFDDLKAIFRPSYVRLKYYDK